MKITSKLSLITTDNDRNFLLFALSNHSRGKKLEFYQRPVEFWIFVLLSWLDTSCVTCFWTGESFDRRCPGYREPRTLSVINVGAWNRSTFLLHVSLNWASELLLSTQTFGFYWEFPYNWRYHLIVSSKLTCKNMQIKQHKLETFYRLPADSSNHIWKTYACHHQPNIWSPFKYSAWHGQP